MGTYTKQFQTTLPSIEFLILQILKINLLMLMTKIQTLKLQRYKLCKLKLIWTVKLRKLRLKMKAITSGMELNGGCVK